MVRRMTEKTKNVMLKVLLSKHQGIDKLIVCLGLCALGLVLVSQMETPLSTYINTLVGNITTKSNSILGS